VRLVRREFSAKRHRCAAQAAHHNPVQLAALAMPALDQFAGAVRIDQ
jgi:hypothetical protein